MFAPVAAAGAVLYTLVGVMDPRVMRIILALSSAALRFSTDGLGFLHSNDEFLANFIIARKSDCMTSSHYVCTAPSDLCSMELKKTESVALKVIRLHVLQIPVLH